MPERGPDTTEDNDDLVAQLKALLHQEPSGASRHHWYPLENGLFPVLADSDAARRYFVSLLVESVIQTFGNEPARFVFVLSVGSRGEEGQSFPVYSMWSHHREFVAWADHRHATGMRRMINARLNMSNAEGLARVLQDLVESGQTMAGWRWEGKLGFGPAPAPHVVTYEPAIRRVLIEHDTAAYADPEEYDEKVTTTSEALRYMCAVGNRPAPAITSFDRFVGNRPLLQLTTYLLDQRTFDFARFRVLRDDPETWNFRYPEVEAELTRPT
ncbi:hypothetical protein ED92_38485 [Amycolatopsis sp. MJM2582]|nr:hypothetical protein ED92_38485 [Amycolatopsis sp. MJM2582]